ncbi:hypothetical protein ACIA8O_38945 [Kitasatospora sp. NPDC051853]|uniref:hypothetical protein n=1 Tax=Kitasatospora sp. NPDC051853 TaxID=3364058 RepID=UPI00378748E4
MAGSPSTMIRKHLFGLAKVYDCHTLDVRPEGRGRWRVEWTEGPSVTVIRTSVAREFPDLAAGIRYVRETGVRPHLVGALRALATMSEHDLDRLDHHRLENLADAVLDDVTDPWDTASPREKAMVERLLAATAVRDPWGDVVHESWDHALAELVRCKGIAWLLEPQPAPAADQRGQGKPDAPAAGLDLTPLELLTVRYAAGPDRTAWLRQTTTLPPDRALAAVLADQHPGRPEALAALRLVAGLRAELDAAEARVIDAARAADATWTEVGAALGGITKQAAAERRGRLANRASRKP